MWTGFAWLTTGTNITVLCTRPLKFGAFVNIQILTQACVNSGRLVTQTVEFCTPAPNIFSVIISVFSLDTKMRISSRAPSNNSQITGVHRSLQKYVLLVQNLLHNILHLSRILRWLLNNAAFADHCIITTQSS